MTATLPEVRLIASLTRDGKTHAATFLEHPIWGFDWFPLCTGDHLVHTGEAERPEGPVDAQVSCPRCLRRLTKVSP